MTAPDSQSSRGSASEGDAGAPIRDPLWWALLVAGLLTRLVWVIWVHPPQDHVFSDMAHYVHRAQLLANFAVEPGMREMAWQAWGTHALVAIPMLLLGPGESALELAALVWAACSAATVVWGYELARWVWPRGGTGPQWPAAAIGLVLLLWFPLVSHAGFFISETPYTCALLATTCATIRVIRTGRGGLAAGTWAALAWILRPQCAVFLVLLGLMWLRDRHRGALASGSRRVDVRQALRFALPLVIALGVSSLRFHYYTGAPGWVAENASMNLTAGRCHNIVTRAFSTEAEREAARSDAALRGDRRVSLPGFRALERKGPDHPLALRPALGAETIDFVGYIGDPAPHRAIRSRCYAATGLGGQLRYSVTNAALLWWAARPWPESSDHGAPELLPVAMRGRDVAAALAPLALLGMVLALLGWARRGARGGTEAEVQRRASLALCALQLASLLVVAAVFFGSPRLRVPYDPYALILALGAALEVGAWLGARRRAIR